MFYCFVVDFFCNFEQNNCGFEDVMPGRPSWWGTDEFDWTRLAGKTHTSNTGPDKDHTTNSADGMNHSNRKKCIIFNLHFIILYIKKHLIII